MGSNDSKSDVEKSKLNSSIFTDHLDDKKRIRESSTFYLTNQLDTKYKDKLKRKQTTESTPPSTSQRRHVLPQPYVFTDANKRMVLQPKINQIYDDYIISKQVLGLGISGKVLCCTSKTSNRKYALKVAKKS